MTALKKGFLVHGGDLTSSGAWLGSPCRYKGVLQATVEDRRYVKLADGSVRRFSDDELHHADDCPNPEASKGRR